MESRYEIWKSNIEYLKNELMKRYTLLRQYVLWLENSEKYTEFKGEDVYSMLVGVLQGLSDVDFIPGIGWGNFVAVVGKVQKETGLDLGVCQFLSSNIEGMKRFEYLGEKSEKTFSECKATMGMNVGSLAVCLPPQRCDCPYRKAKLEQKLSNEL